MDGRGGQVILGEREQCSTLLNMKEKETDDDWARSVRSEATVVVRGEAAGGSGKGVVVLLRLVVLVAGRGVLGLLGRAVDGGGIWCGRVDVLRGRVRTGGVSKIGIVCIDSSAVVSR